LADEMSFEMGSLLEPLCVAMHARDRVGAPVGGETVLVLGAGAVGLLCAAVCKKDKATVVIADINQDRIDFAVRRGFADAAVLVPMLRPDTTEQKLDFAKDVAESVRTATVSGRDAGEPKVCFECTGVEACLQTAIYVSRAASGMGWTFVTPAPNTAANTAANTGPRQHNPVGRSC
jgi:L-iditol 2-dehydrogenase